MSPRENFIINAINYFKNRNNTGETKKNNANEKRIGDVYDIHTNERQNATQYEPQHTKNFIYNSEYLLKNLREVSEKGDIKVKGNFKARLDRVKRHCNDKDDPYIDDLTQSVVDGDLNPNPNPSNPTDRSTIYNYNCLGWALANIENNLAMTQTHTTELNRPGISLEQRVTELQNHLLEDIAKLGLKTISIAESKLESAQQKVEEDPEHKFIIAMRMFWKNPKSWDYHFVKYAGSPSQKNPKKAICLWSHKQGPANLFVVNTGRKLPDTVWMRHAQCTNDGQIPFFAPPSEIYNLKFTLKDALNKCYIESISISNFVMNATINVPSLNLKITAFNLIMRAANNQDTIPIKTCNAINPNKDQEIEIKDVRNTVHNIINSFKVEFRNGFFTFATNQNSGIEPAYTLTPNNFFLDPEQFSKINEKDKVTLSIKNKGISISCEITDSKQNKYTETEYVTLMKNIKHANEDLTTNYTKDNIYLLDNQHISVQTQVYTGYEKPTKTLIYDSPTKYILVCKDK